MYTLCEARVIILPQHLSSQLTHSSPATLSPHARTFKAAHHFSLDHSLGHPLGAAGAPGGASSGVSDSARSLQVGGRQGAPRLAPTRPHERRRPPG